MNEPAAPVQRPSRSLTMLAVVTLALGFVTDYGSALLCRNAGVAGASSIATGVGSASDAWSVRVWQGARRDAMAITMIRPSSEGLLPADEAVKHLPHSTWRDAYHRVIVDSGIKNASISGQAYGWPLRSWAGYFITANPTGRITAWVQVPWRSQREFLPYLPLLPGVLVNTVLFAAVWMGALLAVRRLVRRRAKPGTCEECGYDLRGLSGEKCPECGAAMAATGT